MGQTATQETNCIPLRFKTTTKTKLKTVLKWNLRKGKHDVRIVIPMQLHFSVKEVKKVFKDKKVSRPLVL
jgi:hypothetical protein